ncbi:MAG: zinc ribbon domain-containing protein [Bacillota bacterium]
MTNFCAKCGANVSEGNAFCETCGAPMNSKIIPEKSKSSLFPLIIIIGILILGVVSYGALSFFNKWPPFSVQQPIVNNGPSQTTIPGATTAPAIISVIYSTPDDAVNGFYDALLSGKLDIAYDALCASNKANNSLENFKKWQYLKKKFLVMKKFAIKNITKTGSDSNSAEFDVFTTSIDFRQSKAEVNNNSSLNAVLENGSWKVLRKDLLLTKEIASAYFIIGNMFETGTSYKKNLPKAILNYNYSSTFFYKNGENFYRIGYTYSLLKNHKLAIANYKKAIMYITDKVEKSTACLMAGYSYYLLKNIPKAKAYFGTALKFNNNNQVARNNLKILNKR